MEIVALIARIMFSVMFVSSGINHITKRKYMAEYAGQMGVPAATAAVPVSGVMLLGGAIMVALGIFGDLGAALIVAFLIPTALLMHPFWRFDDAQQRQQQQIHFMKNLTMAGGALALIALFMCQGGALSITGALFG
ncbi:MAG: DoxX family protein [Actinomycetota bacterium]|nr:DoxX family protein [Actinomycetota bacterium]